MTPTRIALCLSSGPVDAVDALPAGARATAYPISGFDVPFGNTCTKGTITWYARSVRVQGEHRSVDSASCRATGAYALGADDKELGVDHSPYPVCGQSGNFGFIVSADVPGKASVVRVCLDGGATKVLACKRHGRP